MGLFISSTANGEGSHPSAGASLNGRGELLRGADLVLLHGKIWTGEAASAPGAKPAPVKSAQAVAIANGRVLAAGSDAEIQGYAGASTKVVDLL